MKKNPLLEIQKFGQSIWLDYIRRAMLQSRELEGLIIDDGIRGVTVNPSILEKAIAGSSDYDYAIGVLAGQSKGEAEIYETLATTDVRRAADLFYPLYSKTAGKHGYVSLEVSPKIASDTELTIQEARRFWQELDRPNVMIKVPATKEGLPAIRQLISEGININVTLLFGLPRYRQVVEAYLSGIEDRLERGEPIDRVASVASFFLSRIDVMVDPILGRIIKADKDNANIAARLHGQVAVASAKLAYQIYKQSFDSDRFRRLSDKGANAQRVLWASTSTKNPSYSDIKYVEALIGPDTVNTLPLETLNAYRDHGEPRSRLEEGLDEAEKMLARLPEAGVDIDQITQKLEVEGVQKFKDAYNRLMQTLQQKSLLARGGTVDQQHLSLGA